MNRENRKKLFQIQSDQSDHSFSPFDQANIEKVFDDQKNLARIAFRILSHRKFCLNFQKP